MGRRRALKSAALFFLFVCMRAVENGRPGDVVQKSPLQVYVGKPERKEGRKDKKKEKVGGSEIAGDSV